jgi:GlpG protein
VFLAATAGRAVPESVWQTLVGSGFDAWNGRWWTLVTSAFVHVQIWHVAFNVYWLWVLGRVLEEAIGPFRWSLFCLSAAFVSSAAQLAWSDEVGIGFSGVAYALFGFMWIARPRWPSFARVVNRDTVLLFLVWFVLCIAATWTGMWNVGNAAHAGGLVYGGLLGAAAARPRRRAAALAGTGALLAASVALLLYAPWSATWSCVQGYRAHVREDYAEAERSYLRALDLSARPAWVLGNLVRVYGATGEKAKYESTLERLRAIDPEAARKLAGGG